MSKLYSVGINILGTFESKLYSMGSALGLPVSEDYICGAGVNSTPAGAHGLLH